MNFFIFTFNINNTLLDAVAVYLKRVLLFLVPVPQLTLGLGKMVSSCTMHYGAV